MFQPLQYVAENDAVCYAGHMRVDEIKIVGPRARRAHRLLIPSGRRNDTRHDLILEAARLRLGALIGGRAIQLASPSQAPGQFRRVKTHKQSSTAEMNLDLGIAMPEMDYPVWHVGDRAYVQKARVPTEDRPGLVSQVMTSIGSQHRLNASALRSLFRMLAANKTLEDGEWIFEYFVYQSSKQDRVNLVVRSGVITELSPSNLGTILEINRMRSDLVAGLFGLVQEARCLGTHLYRDQNYFGYEFYPVDPDVKDLFVLQPFDFPMMGLKVAKGDGIGRGLYRVHSLSVDYDRIEKILNEYVSTQIIDPRILAAIYAVYRRVIEADQKELIDVQRVSESDETDCRILKEALPMVSRAQARAGLIRLITEARDQSADIGLRTLYEELLRKVLSERFF